MNGSDTNKDWKNPKECRQREDEKSETDKTNIKSAKFSRITWW